MGQLGTRRQGSDYLAVSFIKVNIHLRNLLDYSIRQKNIKDTKKYPKNTGLPTKDKISVTLCGIH